MLWFLIYFRMYIHYIRGKISTGLYKGGNLWWRGNPECWSKIKHKTKSVFDCCIDYLHYSWLLVLLCCNIITIDTKKVWCETLNRLALNLHSFACKKKRALFRQSRRLYFITVIPVVKQLYYIHNWTFTSVKLHLASPFSNGNIKKDGFLH